MVKGEEGSRGGVQSGGGGGGYFPFYFIVSSLEKRGKLDVFLKASHRVSEPQKKVQ